MGHYSDIRDAQDEKEAKAARRQALRDVVHRLEDALGIPRSSTATVGQMLKLKASARRMEAKLKTASDLGDTVFDALVTHGEIDATISE